MTKRLWYLVVGLILVILILFGGIAGITYEVTKALKDSKLNGAVLTARGTNEPIQTAKTEMTVSPAGVLSMRQQGESQRSGRRSMSTDLPGIGRRSTSRRQDCSGDGTCPVTTVSSTISTSHPLSSLLADSYFDELKTLKIVQEPHWISFMVFAVARYKQQASRHGSVVVLYTHVGELTLDGEGIMFEESIQGAFKRAGLRVDKNGRRLLGVTQVVGLFNLLESAFEGAGLEDDAMPRMPGDQFYLNVCSVACAMHACNHVCN